MIRHLLVVDASAHARWFCIHAINRGNRVRIAIRGASAVVDQHMRLFRCIVDNPVRSVWMGRLILYLASLMDLSLSPFIRLITRVGISLFIIRYNLPGITSIESFVSRVRK